ncbi:MAG: hypothetical protein ABSE73_31045, partial [Planctomycetota bacterium]
ARGRPAGREDEGGRDARGTLWATHLLTCTREPPEGDSPLDKSQKHSSVVARKGVGARTSRHLAVMKSVEPDARKVLACLVVFELTTTGKMNW